jgi:murein L,D-transpeptidase YcbB/YkuD
MRSSLPRLLAGSAVAVALTLSAGQATYAQGTQQGAQDTPAAAGTNASGELTMVDGVPVPDTTLPPPPTIADIEALEQASPPTVAAQAAPATDLTPVTTASTTESATDSAATAPATAATATPAVAVPETASAPVAASPTNVATPAPAATPAPVVSADNAVAEKLRALSSGKYDRILGSKKERAAVEAFYSTRDFAPLWLTGSSANAAAQAAIGYLHGVDADALDPADYPTPDFTTAKDAEALAEAEMRLTDSVLKFAHHASVGRVHFTRVGADIQYDLKAPEPEAVLKQLADAKDVAAALDSFNPQAPAYKKLKAKLAELRAGDKQHAKGPAPIAHGPTL